MSIDEPPPVLAYRDVVTTHLEHLQQTKSQDSIPSPVSDAECLGLKAQLEQLQQHDGSVPSEGSSIYAILETVFRDIFVSTISSTSITEASFSRVWVLLDVITILSDHGLCESSLAFWLVEDLLDSQTIDGCRKVFDFLESRRERMTKENFKQKHLAILRCCNELLRRLSRAEDTVFCGRVFIFMFQSFPLGDRSSVNLRGEFHVENLTTFDPAPQKSEDAIKPMEIDSQVHPPTGSGSATPSSTQVDSERPQTAGKAISSDRKDSKQNEPVDLDVLYPRFWSLQSFFSNPVKLFEPANMAAFKDGIALTLSCFQTMRPSTTSAAARPDDTGRGTKRKRSEVGVDASTSTFNPKYLTNRDLFELELHDIAFRRHILVQTLIMIDFLLSLTPSGKAKLSGLHNSSVLYDYTLSPDDIKWASSTRSRIAEYLQQGAGTEGKSYYRMVDTVLSRDKNWVRWKAENCPSISRDPVPYEVQIETQHNLAKSLPGKRPLVPPPGSTDLDFLNKTTSMEDLIAVGRQKKERIPTMKQFYDGIRNDELDAEMGSPEEMEEAKERAANKLWRALRASGRRFDLCERIESGNKLGALIDEDVRQSTAATGLDGTGEHDGDRDSEDESGESESAGMNPDESVKQEGHNGNTIVPGVEDEALADTAVETMET